MKLIILLNLIIFIFIPVWAQDVDNISIENFSIDEVSFVGMKLDELIGNFGAPKTVFASRGIELWQDDVVFQYDQGDFYIYKDRVWQVKLSSAFGIKTGDPKQAVLLLMGDNLNDKGDHVLQPVPGKTWPMMFRVNFNNTGRVTSILIYRSDY